MTAWMIEREILKFIVENNERKKQEILNLCFLEKNIKNTNHRITKSLKFMEVFGEFYSILCNLRYFT